MEDADGARAYFPAAQVRYHNLTTTTPLEVNCYGYRPCVKEEWNTEVLSCAFSCRILQRGARISTPGFGVFSSRNGGSGAANYAYYSCFHFQLTSRVWTTEGGNISALHYAENGWPYLTDKEIYNNWRFYLLDNSLGDIRILLKNRRLTVSAFGKQLNTTLATMRYNADYSNTGRLSLLGLGNLDALFYGSYWRNAYLQQAWQCLPMHSADGQAALFETNTQQLLEDEALSIA